MPLTLDLPQVDPLTFARLARGVLEAMVPMGRVQVRELPALYRAGVRWRLDNPSHLTDPWTCARRKWGTCAHLCLWRICELREKASERATFRIILTADSGSGARMFHVQVRRADGRIEDPSRKLGMR